MPARGRSMKDKAGAAAAKGMATEKMAVVYPGRKRMIG
jgi:hypothetical protein